MKKICLCLIFFSLSACEIGQTGSGIWSPDNENVNPVNAVLQFTDIPVPRDFKVDSENSFSRENGSKRFGKLIYYGKMDLNEVETFMVNQLEFHQWKFLSKTLRGGESALFFEKGTESLEIYIRKSSGWNTRLEVILG